MHSQTTVTQKGQITLSKKMRDELKISAHDTVQLELTKDHIKVRKTVDILDLAGFLKPKKGKSVMKAREAMEKNYTRF